MPTTISYSGTFIDDGGRRHQLARYEVRCVYDFLDLRSIYEWEMRAYELRNYIYRGEFVLEQDELWSLAPGLTGTLELAMPGGTFVRLPIYLDGCDRRPSPSGPGVFTAYSFRGTREPVVEQTEPEETPTPVVSSTGDTLRSGVYNSDALRRLREEWSQYFTRHDNRVPLPPPAAKTPEPPKPARRRRVVLPAGTTVASG